MKRGFTLIELLVSIVLMVILLSAVTMIFFQTTETVATSVVCVIRYTNISIARYAMEMLENDLLGCLQFGITPATPPAPGAPTPPESQSFSMDNGKVTTPGSFPDYTATGGHDGKSGDRLSFRSLTVVGDVLVPGQICYELIPGDNALAPPAMSVLPIPPPGSTMAGDSSHRETVRTLRPLYTLVRRVRLIEPNPIVMPALWNQVPKDLANQDVPDTEVCHYVLSFNVEYFANTRTWSQLDPSPCTSAAPPSPRDPLGNGKGPNDLGLSPPDPNQGPFRITAIRITMIVVDDIGERQARVITKVCRIPIG